MRSQCSQKTLLHRGHSIGTNQPPAVRRNHVDRADFDLRDTRGGRHFWVKEAQLIQRRAPFTPHAVGVIVAKFNNAMLAQQTAESAFLFLPPQIALQ